ncbi:MAG: chloride channel protein [Gemmatimonadota bacterium]
MIARIRRVRDALLARMAGAEDTFMMLVAACIGCLGGLGAVGFRALISGVQRIAWGDLPYSIDLVAGHPWWWIVIVPAIGGLLVGPLVWFLAREASGHGVPEVIEAVALKSGVIRPRVVAVKSLASALTIGTGGSVGREGPIVQIGAAFASGIGQALHVSGSRLRTLVGCGAAAGIAATFNAPVAGALFAVEVILGDFAVARFSPIVISSVLATVVSRHFLGDSPAFDVPPHGLVSAWELGIYVVLGLAAAAVALLLIWIVYWMEDVWKKLPLAGWVMPAVGGLIVGGIGLAYPHALGVGYEAINLALDGRLALSALLALVVVKLLATSVTLGSGGSGGVFAPSLFLGAMLGGAIGYFANLWFPNVTEVSGAYALVGMGAVVAGTTHAPITAILIIFELTSDYTLILPLMASCIIATVVTTTVRKESIYTLKLLRRGVDIFKGRELNVLKSLEVDDVMTRDLPRVREDEPLASLIERMATTSASSLYVTADGDRYLGRIEFPDLRRTLVNADVLTDLIVAGDVVHKDDLLVRPHERLDVVMRMLATRGPDELAVVSRDGKLLGGITRRHLLDAYNQELLKRDMASSIGAAVSSAASHEVHFGGDSTMLEADAPGPMCGKALRELDLRARFGVQCLLVLRPAQPGSEDRIEMVPGPDTVIQRGDRLLLMGSNEALATVSRW